MLRRAALCFSFALATSFFAGVGCLSPTLPLPPPEPADTMLPLAEQPGTWQVAGSCLEGALVTLFNERTHRGVVVEDTDRNGRYVVELEAEVCDNVLLSQQVVNDESGSEESASRAFVIEARTPSGVIDDVCH